MLSSKIIFTRYFNKNNLVFILKIYFYFIVIISQNLFLYFILFSVTFISFFYRFTRFSPVLFYRVTAVTVHHITPHHTAHATSYFIVSRHTISSSFLNLHINAMCVFFSPSCSPLSSLLSCFHCYYLYGYISIFDNSISMSDIRLFYVHLVRH